MGIAQEETGKFETTTLLDQISRDREFGGVITASSVQMTVCGCCGQPRMLFMDRAGRVFATARLSTEHLTNLAADFISAGLQSEGLTGAWPRKKH